MKIFVKIVKKIVKKMVEINPNSSKFRFWSHFWTKYHRKRLEIFRGVKGRFLEKCVFPLFAKKRGFFRKFTQLLTVLGGSSFQKMRKK